VTNTTNDQRPADSTDEPTDNNPKPWSDAHAAALLRGVLHSSEPGLTDDELRRLGAVIEYLSGDDALEIQPPETGPSPYPTGSAASHLHAAGAQGGIASEKVPDETTAREIARLAGEFQAIGERLSRGEQA